MSSDLGISKKSSDGSKTTSRPIIDRNYRLSSENDDLILEAIHNYSPVTFTRENPPKSEVRELKRDDGTMIGEVRTLLESYKPKTVDEMKEIFQSYERNLSEIAKVLPKDECVGAALKVVWQSIATLVGACGFRLDASAKLFGKMTERLTTSQLVIFGKILEDFREITSFERLITFLQTGLDMLSFLGVDFIIALVVEGLSLNWYDAVLVACSLHVKLMSLIVTGGASAVVFGFFNLVVEITQLAEDIYKLIDCLKERKLIMVPKKE